MPYKNMADQVAANRRYRKRKKTENKKTDALTEAYEKLIRDFEEANKKKEQSKKSRET